MTNKELSLQEKEAIRKYMKSLVALPGIVVAIAMFVMGFFINDVAKRTAYDKAYQQATTKVMDIAYTALEANAKAAQALSESTDLQREATAIRDSLRTAEAFQSSEERVNEIVDSLAKRTDFQQSIISKVDERFQTLLERANKAHSRLNGLSLKVIQTAKSPEFACGGEDKKQEDLWVMYGCKDGTGCNVKNANYYKELGLVVPPER
jgi:hypothetical protein